MKKLFVPFLALTLAAFVVSPCARAEDNSAIESKLKQMEDSWEKAFVDKDATAVDSMVADDYAGVNSKGKHQNKSELLDEIKTEPDTLAAATNDKMEFHVTGRAWQPWSARRPKKAGIRPGNN